MAWVDGMDERDQLRWLVKENERLRAALGEIANSSMSGVSAFRNRAIARRALDGQAEQSDEEGTVADG